MRPSRWGELVALAGDQESYPLADVTFPDPVITDAPMAATFVRLHVALELASTRVSRAALARPGSWTAAENPLTIGPPYGGASETL